MNPVTFAAKLRAVNIPVLSVTESTDTDQEDHTVEITASIHVQVPATGRNVSVCAVAGTMFNFYPDRASTNLAGIKSDIADAQAAEISAAMGTDSFHIEATAGAYLRAIGAAA